MMGFSDEWRLRVTGFGFGVCFGAWALVAIAAFLQKYGGRID